MLRFSEIQKRWPDKSSALLEEMKRTEAHGHDPVDVLLDDKLLEASGLVVADVFSAVVERLTDAGVRAAVAESLAAADLTGHLRSFRRRQRGAAVLCPARDEGPYTGEGDSLQ